SVVVPVYNPGQYMEVLIDSLLAQKEPPGGHELIFVDDGSTDGSGERLDRLAAEHAHVRVVHQPNSGWPGKPRNVGIDAARGEFVFFSDHDDKLTPKALDRMVAMARRTGADVLIPKMIGIGRRVPRNLFRENVDAAVLGEHPVMSALTPHKLFRREFLNQHGLRFPEGKRRLEDHVFVVEAYLLANVISILADYPCYYHLRRDDRGNAAYEKWDAKYYFSFVAEVIDVIDRHTEPGPLREALLYRPYRTEMLGRLIAERSFRWDDELRAEVFECVRTLALERFPADFHQRLAIIPRAHAAALIANRLDQITDVAARTAALTVRPAISNPRWSEGSWHVDVEAEFLEAEGGSLRLIPNGDGWSIDPRVVPSELQPERYATNEVMVGNVDVLVRHRARRVEWYLATAIKPHLVEIPDDPERAHRLVMRGTASLDPMTIANGGRLGKGRWQLQVHADLFGILRMSPAEVESGSAPAPLVLLAPPGPAQLVRPLVTDPKQRLVFKVAPPPRPATKHALMEARAVATTPNGDLTATVNLASGPDSAPTKHNVVLRGGAKSLTSKWRRTHAARAALVAAFAKPKPGTS
ncbi:MAG: glycosyltransferase family 2 protein, partial [Mycobacteriales bacterium]